MKDNIDYIEQIKKMVDYDDTIFDNNGDGFIALSKCVSEYKTYSDIVLYIAKKCLLQEKYFTIKDIQYILQTMSRANINKILESFEMQALIIKIKKRRHNTYIINKDEECLKVFRELLEIAKNKRLRK